MGIIAGSFRDPSGRVYAVDGRILRTVTPFAAADYEAVKASRALTPFIEAGRLVAAEEVDKSCLGPDGQESSYVLEHPRLPLVSYPYEWPFEGLKAAALAHLDLQLEALERDVVLSDASAYNVQFRGAVPVFIDYLSFRPYREGEYWQGHRQFCEQFLNPLLLRALFGLHHNAWYRGGQEGITAVELNRLLRWRHKIRPSLLMHVVMPARFQLAATSGDAAKLRNAKQRPLPKSAYLSILTQLRTWIAKLRPQDKAPSVWSRYDLENNYTDADHRAKADFIRDFAAATKPEMLWDLGCNTGEYSELALKSGAAQVVGFDIDHQALDQAFRRATERGLNLTPLYLDAANPSPDQGWNGAERQSLKARARADALVALAFIHHLVIGRNVPLADVLRWLLDLAPQGVIEFVPKTDPQVARMLALREDIFPDYSEETFLGLLQDHAEIVQRKHLAADQRLLVWYRRA